MRKLNRLLVGCDMYDITAAYRRGAITMRNSIPCNCNPYSMSTQEYYDWDSGHVNESVGYHFADNIDPITFKQNGTTFIID